MPGRIRPSQLAWSPALLLGRPDFPSHPPASVRSGQRESPGAIPRALASSAGATLGPFHSAGLDVGELGNPAKPAQEPSDEPEAGVRGSPPPPGHGSGAQKPLHGAASLFPLSSLGRNQPWGGRFPALGPRGFSLDLLSGPSGGLGLWRTEPPPGFEPAPGRRTVRAARPQPPRDAADAPAPAFSCPLYLGFIDSC